eukprot:7355108-Prymnesium_polylepis.1
MLHGQVPPHEWQGALVGGQRDDGLIEFGYDDGDIMLYKLEELEFHFQKGGLVAAVPSEEG